MAVGFSGDGHGAARDVAGRECGVHLARVHRWARRRLLPGVVMLALLATAGCGGGRTPAPSLSAGSSPMVGASAIPLPTPRARGPLSLEEALAARRSVRSFARRPLTLAQTAQLLWAAQGVTDARIGYRAAPSAGALYPLEVLLVAAEVEGLPPGVYRYVPAAHALRQVLAGAPREELLRAALSQAAVGEAPAVLVVTAEFARTTARYGVRGERYVLMEAGHAAQNVYLQAEALGLGTVSVGAFDDDAVRRALALAGDEQPLYLLPCGEPDGH